MRGKKITLKKMDQNELFKTALGLEKPWEVETIKFSEESGRLDIKVRHKKGYEFCCENCEEKNTAYDTVEREWRHLNFFQYETYIHASVPRIKCPECGGIRNVKVPWARKNSGFTLLFEAFVMELSRAMPLSVLGKIVSVNDTRLMRIIKHYVVKARDKKDMSSVKKVAIDETSKAKGHDYITVFIDLMERCVLFATEGKDNVTIKKFVEDLESHGGKAENIEQTCSDLSPAFQKGISENLPNADMIFDRFHVMKLIVDALDKVRREESKRNPMLKGSRYAWLHNPETATKKQKEMLSQLTKQNLKTTKAYQIRLALRDIYELTDYDLAEKALKKWYFWATHSRIEPIIKVAKSIKKHWNGVLNFFSDRITNGIAEGINSIIQTIKRRARGYRNTDNFITMVYLVCGKLNFDLPSVFTHGK